MPCFISGQGGSGILLLRACFNPRGREQFFSSTVWVDMGVQNFIADAHMAILELVAV